MVASWLVLYSWVMFDSVHDSKCLLVDGRVSPDSDLDGRASPASDLVERASLVSNLDGEASADTDLDVRGKQLLATLICVTWL